MPVTLYEGDCLSILPTLPKDSIDAVICDPPYHLTQLSRGGSPRINNTATPFGRTRLGDKGFCNQVWDGGDIAFRPETWVAIHDVMKPGAFLASFGGTRTYHRMAVAIEDAGFELKDTLMWVYSTSFPKVGYIRDRDGNQFRDGWGGSLKPAVEPILLARRAPEGSTVDNMRKYGTGALNIDSCRIPIDPKADQSQLRPVSRGIRQDGNADQDWGFSKHADTSGRMIRPEGRWPSNFLHDGSDEVLNIFAGYGETKSGIPGVRRKAHETNSMAGRLAITGETEVGYADSGNVSRFFQACEFSEEESASRLIYCTKASKADRFGSKHPTIKPISLLRYVVRLITPPDGTVLDPFAGSGTTGQAAMDEGFDAILIEREPTYCDDIRRRLVLFLEHDFK